MDFVQQIDDKILYFIEENLHGGFMDYFFSAINFLMIGGWIWIALGIVMLFSRKWRLTGALLLFTLGVSALVGNVVLKNLLFERTRPFNADPSIELLIPIPKGEYSFPSCHALTCAASGTALYIRNKAAGIAGLIFAVLVSLSRIFFAVHYFSDIIAGFVFGIIFALIIHKFCVNGFDKLIKKAEKKFTRKVEKSQEQ